MRTEGRRRSFSRFQIWLLALVAISEIFTFACSGKESENETSVAALRQQYPEIFTVVDSVDCGKPLGPAIREFQRVWGTQANTTNTGGGAVLKQGPVRVVVGRYYAHVVDPPGVRENRCPLLVLPPDYVGGQVFLDDLQVATVKAGRTPLLVSDEVKRIRITQEGLPDIEERVYNKGRNYLIVGPLETVVVEVYTPEGYRLDQLTVDNKPVNVTTSVLKLEPGTYVLRLSSPGKTDLYAEVDLDGMRPYRHVYRDRFRPIGAQP